VRAGTGTGAGIGTGTGYVGGLGTLVGGLACGLQELHVLRPGVAFGNAVESTGRGADEHFTTHHSQASSPHSSGEQQPCL
jgi:hypothetical protein